MVRQLASTSFSVLDGNRRQFGLTTIRAWIREYDERGIAGLCRKGRSDRGEARVVISKVWDAGVPFSDEVKTEIAAKLTKYVKSVWATAGGGKGKGAAKSGGGWKICARLATKELIKLTQAAGLVVSAQELLSLCNVPRSFVDTPELRNFAIIALKNNDAKAFADTAAPRTRRTRSGMVPMELVVGDVHHLDIYLQRADGSKFTPKVIAWLDLATNRVFATVHFLPKGKGIRQEDVIMSFIEMTQHPEWGMPQALYLDNGGEYSKLGFVNDAMKLASFAQCQSFRVGIADDDPKISGLIHKARRDMVIHAQPYNAPAKPIEGIFAVLERGPLAMVPGWIGGNRMTAKTKNVGQEPQHFEGDESEFRQVITTALDYYHTTAQNGSLNGKSPREAFALAVNYGWKRTDVEPLALQSVFAVEEVREVTQGEFTYKNITYRADGLLHLLPGTKVRIRVPLAGSKSQLPVLDEQGRYLCIAEPAPLCGFIDPSGAKDRRQRIGTQNRAIARMSEEVEDLDLVNEMREAADLHPAAPIPESGGTIRLSDEMQAIAKAKEQLPTTRAQTQDDQCRERLYRSAVLEKLAAAG